MTTPVQVPELVHALSDHLASADYGRYIGHFLTSMAKPHPDLIPSEAAAEAAGLEWCAEERARLNITTLFHVSDSMLAVAKMAAKSLSETEVWDREILPANLGFLVFETPIHLTDIRGRTIGFKVVSWRWAPLDDGTQIWMVNYSDRTDMQDEYSASLAGVPGTPRSTRAATLGRLEVAHMSAIRSGQTIGPMSWAGRDADWDGPTDPRADNSDYDEVLPEKLPEMENLGRILYAIFALMSETITSVQEFEHRKTTKAYARRGILLPSKVVVIKLRRESQSGRRDPESGRFLLYQAMTRGHWRMQPYGPGRNQVKRIWIHPFMRGNPDGPVIQSTRVTSLAR